MEVDGGSSLGSSEGRSEDGRRAGSSSEEDESEGEERRREDEEEEECDAEWSRSLGEQKLHYMQTVGDVDSDEEYALGPEDEVEEEEEQLSEEVRLVRHPEEELELDDEEGEEVI